MSDLLFTGVFAGFLILTWGLVSLCELLMRGRS